MEAVIHLDTQIVVWLHLADRRRLRPVRKTLERFALEISPAVLLELEYLSEIGRTNYGADRVAAGLAEKIGLRVSDASFSEAIRNALRQHWTRDPFDRMIVGTAMAAGNPLLTRDHVILKHFKKAMWR